MIKAEAMRKYGDKGFGNNKKERKMESALRHEVTVVATNEP